MARENLITARKAKGLTQTQLAKAIGVCCQTVSKYESGKANPSEDTWRKLSGVLKRTVNHLWVISE